MVVMFSFYEPSLTYAILNNFPVENTMRRSIVF